MGNSVISYWNLRYEPFENNITDKFFYESATHSEALARLNYLVNKNTGSIGVLSGAVGTGKTLTRSIFVSRLNKNIFLPVVLENTNFTYEEILYEVNTHICHLYNPEHINGLSPKFTFYKDFKEHLVNKIEKIGMKLLLLFDEAQKISPEVFDELKGLTNIHQNGQNPVILIFIGQSEINKNLNSMPQIKQRIGISYHFENLSMEETIKYIRHRLLAAECSNIDFFDNSALNKVYDITNGNPREINRICKLSLEFAAGLNKNSIDDNLLDSINEDLKKSSEVAVQNSCA